MLRRVAVSLFLAVLLVSATSCGGGSGTVVIIPSGDILVENDVFSFFAIDFVEVAGPDFLQLFPVLLPGEALLVPDLAVGTYRVTIQWTDLSVEVVPFVDVFSGATTPLLFRN